MTHPLLDIQDLHVAVDGQPILKGITLCVRPGELHAVMGPNGSGKSTLALALAGRETFTVTKGSVAFDGQDLLAMSPEARAQTGLFLSFQYPAVITGVNLTYFLRSAVNAVRKARGEEELDAVDFLAWMKQKTSEVGLDGAILARAVNEGFSGGEKKRNEILQMLLLEPRLAVLDETDSGLDIDAVRVVADGVNRFRRADRGFLVITHYQRILQHMEPDFVHVLKNGQIALSGGRDLARELELRGYAWVDGDVAAPATPPVLRVASQ